MKKMIMALMVVIGASAYAGEVSLPTERIALPELQGEHLVCVWDKAANDWHTDFASYDQSGAISFEVPEWGKWYWVGVWDEAQDQYVFGKWVGHFVSN